MVTKFKTFFANASFKLKNKAWHYCDLIMIEDVTKEKGKFYTFLTWFYLIFHFVLGFFILWMAYNQVTQLEAYKTNLTVESLFETLYLVIGVIWGNVGWDGYNRIKAKASAKEIAARFFKFTIPCTGFTALAVNLFLAFNIGFQPGNSIIEWLVLYYNSVDNYLIISILCLFVYTLFPVQRRLKLKRLKSIRNSNWPISILNKRSTNSELKATLNKSSNEVKIVKNNK